MEQLTLEEQLRIRKEIVFAAGKLLGVTYQFGYECKNFTDVPPFIDCSEDVEWSYNHIKLKMVDGAQEQFNFTVPTAKPMIGDLAFFGRENGNASKIYHVGIIFDELNIIEARAFDKDADFETGKVILRPRFKWENFERFAGYRAHPRLIKPEVQNV